LPPLPFLAVILHGPQGCGKSLHAARLCDLLDLLFVVDEWYDGLPLCPGALHLTNDTERRSGPQLLVLPVDDVLPLFDAWMAELRE
jgi:hypothetical protein